MKKILLTILPLLLIVGCSKVEGKQDLIPAVETYRNGNIESITYHKKSRTGIEKVKYEGYHKNGQKKEEGTYKDGKLDGLVTNWYENGKKNRERTYKDGVRDGKWTYWYEDGGKEEGTYKDGKLDGLVTNWYENGQKSGESTYIDGDYDGECTSWYENGQKMEQGTAKGTGRGEGPLPVGEWTYWYDNGQKRYEIDWLSGNQECWDEEGNECECGENWWEGCK